MALCPTNVHAKNDKTSRYDRLDLEIGKKVMHFAGEDDEVYLRSLWLCIVVTTHTTRRNAR